MLTIRIALPDEEKEVGLIPLLSTESMFKDLSEENGEHKVLVEYKILHISGLDALNSIGATILKTNSIEDLKIRLSEKINLKNVHGTDSTIILSKV